MKSWDIKTILLGYDGSAGADQAAWLVSGLAQQNHARIVVVTAFHVRLEVGGEQERTIRAMFEAEEIASKIVGELQAAGIEAEAEVLEGPAGEGLLRAAEAHNADLIAVGRRGHGLTAGLLLGSTSEYVMRQAKVPVLVAH